MRKFLILLLLPMFFLFGCSQEEAAEQGAEFWYLHSAYQYGTEASMFACEYYPDDGADLLPTLTAYIAGPKSPDLRSPFPKNTNMLACNINGSILSVTVSREFAEASSASVSCAAICLAKTGAGLTGCAEVHIYLEDNVETVYMKLSQAEYMLYDDVITDVVTTPEEEVMP